MLGQQAQGYPSRHRVVKKLVVVAVLMFGFGFALVPLYDVFCRVTGLNGKTGVIAGQDAAASIADSSREITVEFMANTAGNAAWEFYPRQAKLKVHPGALYTTTYYARNKVAQTVVGQAVPSVAPAIASKYFSKTECFCFSRQSFLAHEGRDMPVTFIVDPALPDDIKTVTLSYTFFDVSAQAES